MQHPVSASTCCVRMAMLLLTTSHFVSACTALIARFTMTCCNWVRSPTTLESSGALKSGAHKALAMHVARNATLVTVQEQFGSDPTSATKAMTERLKDHSWLISRKHAFTDARAEGTRLFACATNYQTGCTTACARRRNIMPAGALMDHNGADCEMLQPVGM
jgi:hypothetical protein